MKTKKRWREDRRVRERSAFQNRACRHTDEYDYGTGVYVCADCGQVRKEDAEVVV